MRFRFTLHRAPLKAICGLAVLALNCNSILALEGAIGVHDPSTVGKCDGNYYVFGTGRGIRFLVSSNGFDWQRGERVLERIPDSVKQFVPLNNGVDVWAPDLIKLNGEFYLYYSVSKWDSFISAVGLLTNPTLDPDNPNYKWTDRGMVVHSSKGENLNAIDPGVCLAPNGTLWICYGSYHGNIELVQLDPKTGLRPARKSRVTIIARQSEASDIIFHGGFFYLFVNHDSCCHGTNSTYNIRVGRSKKITGPYLDRHNEDLAKGAGTLFIAAQGNNIGPGHFGLFVDDGVEKFSCHYEGVIGSEGRAILDIRPLLWTSDGWPMAGENLTDGKYQIRSLRTGTILQIRDSPTNGVAVQMGRYLSREHQKWNITPAGHGFYKILNAQNETALTAVDALDVSPFSGADNQLWKIDQLSDGSFRVQSKTNKLALAVKLKDRGNGVMLRPFGGDDVEHWVITAP